MVTISKWVVYGVYGLVLPTCFHRQLQLCARQRDHGPTDFHVTAFVHHSDAILHIADWIILIGLG